MNGSLCRPVYGLVAVLCAGWFFWVGRGCCSTPNPSAASAGVEDRQPPAAARRLFQKRCQNCHAEDGSGSVMRDTFPEIPDFRNRRWQKGRSDLQFTVSIRDGKGTHMPPFAGKISKEDTEKLVRLIRSFGPKLAGKELEKSASEFESRFWQLQEEFDRLREKIRELSRPREAPDEASHRLFVIGAGGVLIGVVSALDVLPYSWPASLR
jgi:mono/diheme cytochrome c family protein